MLLVEGGVGSIRGHGGQDLVELALQLDLSRSLVPTIDRSDAERTDRRHPEERSPDLHAAVSIAEGEPTARSEQAEGNHDGAERDLFRRLRAQTHDHEGGEQDVRAKTPAWSRRRGQRLR